MSDTDIYRDTLFYALAIARGERELARQLKVTVAQVRNWLSGAEEIPEHTFQAALDVVIASSPQAIGRSRGFLLSRSPTPH